VLLSAAMIPPQSAVDELAALVRSVADDERQFEAVPPAWMHLPVTRFGNVGPGDVTRIVQALREAAAEWAPPRLRFAGAVALEWPGGESVRAALSGEVDGLTAIARQVPTAVEGLGFFVDRRGFRPWVSVGTVNAMTTPPFQSRLVESLGSYTGPEWWLSHLSLVRKSWAKSDELARPFEVVDEVVFDGSR
jgi:2'-5' RNA ligase